MRTAMLALLALAGISVFASTPASARDRQYCMLQGGIIDPIRRCDFDTIAQCRATASGIGGFCTRNPNFQPQGTAPRKVRRNQRRQQAS